MMLGGVRMYPPIPSLILNLTTCLTINRIFTTILSCHISMNHQFLFLHSQSRFFFLRLLRSTFQRVLLSTLAQLGQTVSNKGGVFLRDITRHVVCGCFVLSTQNSDGLQIATCKTLQKI